MPKQSISFSAGSYITDPPFPPDRMTYVIYHMGPSQTTGRGGDAGSMRCSSSCSWYSASQLAESTADLARGRGRRGGRGERLAGYAACGARAGQRLSSGSVLACCSLQSRPPVQLLMFFRLQPAPSPGPFSLLPSLLSRWLDRGQGGGGRELTGITPSRLACERWSK